MIHHITKIENLKKIFLSGWIYSRNKVNNFSDTADESIIKARNNINEINLNNYVPFHLNYFQERYKIPYNTVVIGNNGKENMVYLIMDNFSNKKALYYCYHPASIYQKNYQGYELFISNLSENYIRLKAEAKKIHPCWELDYSNNEVKQFLMSELLFYSEISVKDISRIIVYSEDVKKKIEDIFEELYKENSIKVNIEIYINNNFY